MRLVGKHTPASEKGFMLPAYQILSGSEGRVRESPGILNLRNVKIHRGARATLVIGRYRPLNGRKEDEIELAVMPHGMGQSSAEIYSREYIAYGKKLEFPGIPYPIMIQMRAGTAGGINGKSHDRPDLHIGDLVVTESNVSGFSSVLSESNGIFHPIWQNNQSQKNAVEFLNYWKSLGGSHTNDGRYLLMDNSRLVMEETLKTAERLGYTAIAGNTLTKDSLYSEGYGHVMEDLYQRYGVRASSMEGTILSYHAAKSWVEDKVKIFYGEVLNIIGALPGEGFPENRRQEKKANEGNTAAMIVAAETIASLHRTILKASRLHMEFARKKKP